MSRVFALQKKAQRFRPHIFLFILFVWDLATATEQKIRGALIASVFAVLEFFFTGIVDSASSGFLRKHPLRAIFSGHTTVEMWLLNLVYAPIGTDLLFAVIPSWGFRLLLSPLTTWLAEIVMGYTLLVAFERRAWHYTDRWARLHGTITLRYAPLWIALHYSHELMVEHVYVPLSRYLAGVLSSALIGMA